MAMMIMRRSARVAETRSGIPSDAATDKPQLTPEMDFLRPHEFGSLSGPSIDAFSMPLVGQRRLVNGETHMHERSREHQLPQADAEEVAPDRHAGFTTNRVIQISMSPQRQFGDLEQGQLLAGPARPYPAPEAGSETIPARRPI